MILRNFVSLRVFTVYMENFAWGHVNADKEVTLHRCEILPQSEISSRFEFISRLM